MLISLTGPSGIGKGFVRQAVLRRFPNLTELPWMTTRTLRPEEERNRSNRIHVDDGEFSALEAQGKLVLVQTLYGNRYGLARELLSADPNAADYLTEFQTDNLEEVWRLGIPVCTIALVPTDLAFLRTRLVHYRGTETPDEIESRLTLAEQEINALLQHRSQLSFMAEIGPENEGNIVPMIIEFLTPILER